MSNRAKILGLLRVSDPLGDPSYNHNLLFSQTDFVASNARIFSTFVADHEGCHARGRQHLFNPECLAACAAGSVSHGSTQMFTTTTDIIALFYFTGYDVCICPLFLVGAESERPISAKYIIPKIKMLCNF